MENFSWWSYLLALGSSASAVWGFFKGAAWVKDRIEKRRKEKIEEARQAIGQAVELKKAEIHTEHLDQESIKQAIWELLKEKKVEVEVLKAELLDQRHFRSLSEAVIRQTGIEIRKLSRQLLVIEIITRQVDHEKLAEEVQKLREAVDRLEAALP